MKPAQLVFIMKVLVPLITVIQTINSMRMTIFY